MFTSRHAHPCPVVVIADDNRGRPVLGTERQFRTHAVVRVFGVQVNQVGDQLLAKDFCQGIKTVRADRDDPFTPGPQVFLKKVS